MLVLDKPDDLEKKCIFCKESINFKDYNVKCHYRPKLKYNKKSEFAEIIVPLCKNHFNKIPKDNLPVGWDWWDIIDGLDDTM